MEQSENLALPYIAASQDQKHITHNEALQRIDALLHMSVISRDLSAPPDSPDEGARYLVASGASGAWADHDGEIAAFQGGVWNFYVLRDGWRLWVSGETKLLIWQDGGWIEAGIGDISAFQNLDMVGINATADETNRLALNAPASLFSHEGAGHQLKVNKYLAADTGSLLFQTNWSGRAEMGLAGNDDFSIKVSGNGDDWSEALRTSEGGFVTMPSGISSGAMILADDTFGSLDIPHAGGLLFVWAADDPYPDATAGRFALLFFDVGNSQSVIPIVLDTAVSLDHSQIPTGTTGPDANLNIFIESRTIHLENRRGNNRTYRWMILA